MKLTDFPLCIYDLIKRTFLDIHNIPVCKCYVFEDKMSGRLEGFYGGRRIFIIDNEYIYCLIDIEKKKTDYFLSQLS